MSRVTKIFVVLLVACGSMGYYLFLELREVKRQADRNWKREQQEWRGKVDSLRSLADSLQRKVDSLDVK